MQVLRNNGRQVKEQVVWGIGVFDGVHRGHQRLLKELRRMAMERKARAGVLTFEPHPLQILLNRPIPLLTSTEEKLQLLEEEGVEVVWVVPFDEAFAQIAPEDFLSRYFENSRLTSGLVAGFDFTFGRDAAGSVHTLEEWAGARGIPTCIVPEVKQNGKKISSSWIREEILEGHMEESAELLGRPYFVWGRVVKGAGRGRTLGYPTINLAIPSEKLLPKTGVYAVRVKIWTEGGWSTSYRGVCNIGFRPTFQPVTDTHPVVEVFLHSFQGSLYHSLVQVEFLSYLREERKYPTVEELREQIRKDVEEMMKGEYSQAGKR